MQLVIQVKDDDDCVEDNNERNGTYNEDNTNEDRHYPSSRQNINETFKDNSEDMISVGVPANTAGNSGGILIKAHTIGNVHIGTVHKIYFTQTSETVPAVSSIDSDRSDSGSDESTTNFPSHDLPTEPPSTQEEKAWHDRVTDPPHNPRQSRLTQADYKSKTKLMEEEIRHMKMANSNDQMLQVNNHGCKDSVINDQFPEQVGFSKGLVEAGPKLLPYISDGPPSYHSAINAQPAPMQLDHEKSQYDVSIEMLQSDQSQLHSPVENYSSFTDAESSNNSLTEALNYLSDEQLSSSGSNYVSFEDLQCTQVMPTLNRSVTPPHSDNTQGIMPQQILPVRPYSGSTGLLAQKLCSLSNSQNRLQTNGSGESMPPGHVPKPPYSYSEQQNMSLFPDKHATPDNLHASQLTPTKTPKSYYEKLIDRNSQSRLHLKIPNQEATAIQTLNQPLSTDVVPDASLHSPVIKGQFKKPEKPTPAPRKNSPSCTKYISGTAPVPTYRKSPNSDALTPTSLGSMLPQSTSPITKGNISAFMTVLGHNLSPEIILNHTVGVYECTVQEVVFNSTTLSESSTTPVPHVPPPLPPKKNRLSIDSPPRQDQVSPTGNNRSSPTKQIMAQNVPNHIIQEVKCMPGFIDGMEDRKKQDRMVRYMCFFFFLKHVFIHAI